LRRGRSVVAQRFAAVKAVLDRSIALMVKLRLNEAGPLLTVGALSLLALAFVAIAGEVREGELAGFDRALMLALRHADNLAEPIGPRWLREAARDITALGGNTILALVTLGAVAHLATTGKRGAAVLVAASVGGAAALSSVLKLAFARPRPDLVPHGMEVFTASFPSSHAMLSAATYLTIGILLARVQPGRGTKAFLVGAAIVLSLLIGASRVYLGVHWPSDVLAGWCGGAAWALLCWFLALQLQRRGEVEREEPKAAAP
jgi:undecaprenyl-diphosphatase